MKLLDTHKDPITNSEIRKSIELLFKYYNDISTKLDNLGRQLACLQRLLGSCRTESVIARLGHSLIGEALAEQIPRYRTRPLEQIVEEESIPLQMPHHTLQVEAAEVNLSTEIPNISELQIQRVSVDPIDISDLPTDAGTQNLENLSQARKRASDDYISPKRPCRSERVLSRESQNVQKESLLTTNELDKENIPPEPQYQQSPTPVGDIGRIVSLQKIRLTGAHEREPPQEQLVVSAMLQEAGLADMQPTEAQQVFATTKNGSESSETPLGSLDRTKVSLGDSVKTTDSLRFIKNQWGLEGTMVKILNAVNTGAVPVTVESLITTGPVISGYKAIIAARCFTSILKLKQHAFVKIVKDPDTLEIRDITLGPKIAGLL